MNSDETSIEAFLRERLIATERLLSEAVEGQRVLRQMLDEQAGRHRVALEDHVRRHQEALEQNRKLQAKLERLTLMVQGQQTQLAELLKAQGEQGRKPKRDKKERPEDSRRQSPSPLQPPPPKSRTEPEKRKPRREPLPAELERVIERILLEACLGCGSTRLEPQEPQIIEKLAYIKAHVRVRRLVLDVSRCLDCGATSTAPLPPLAVPCGNMDATMLAWLAYAKCGLHLPADRIAKELAHQGVHLASSTLNDAFAKVSWLLDPIFDRLVARLLAHDLIHADGTGMKVLQPGEKGTHRGQFVVWCNHEISAFQYVPSKHADLIADFLKVDGKWRYAGHLVADAASNMNALYQGNGIIECGCWYHLRKKFEEAKEGAPIKAEEGLAWIAAIFDVEHEADALEETDPERLARRRRDTAPLVTAFEQWMEQTKPLFEPDEELYKAVQYYQNHREALRRFLDNGKIPLTNNLAERELGVIGRGRKAYLFAGSDEGARRLATIYTVVRTCQRLGIYPYDYLCDVLPRLSDLPVNREPGLLARLTPQAWMAAQAATETTE